jgi:uncharacterized protein (DUF4415 family)
MRQRSRPASTALRRPEKRLSQTVLGSVPKPFRFDPQRTWAEQVAYKGTGLDTPEQNVIEHFKKDGDGWQTRIDETLQKAVKRKAS